MDLALPIEQISALLQWRWPLLPTEVWLEIALTRLSWLPSNDPAFLHLIESVKRAWWQHFRCIQVKPAYSSSCLTRESSSRGRCWPTFPGAVLCGVTKAMEQLASKSASLDAIATSSACSNAQ